MKGEMVNMNYELLHPSYKAIWDLLGETATMKFYYEFRGIQQQYPMKMYDSVKLGEYLHEKKDIKSKEQIRELSNTYDFSPRWIREHLGQ